jgi:DNA-binding CsgD family transcriptional regulator
MTVSRTGARWVEKESLSQRSRDAQTGELPRDFARWVKAFIVEMSACLQMVTADFYAGTDLEEASARWVQRLLALVAFIERAAGRGHESQASRVWGRYHVTVADTLPADTQQPLDVPDSPGTEASPSPRSRKRSVSHSGARHLLLTLRESEVLRLAEAVGHPPRKIAAKLQIEVGTVYAHLRNARRKRRDWSARQAENSGI